MNARGLSQLVDPETVNTLDLRFSAHLFGHTSRAYHSGAGELLTCDEWSLRVWDLRHHVPLRSVRLDREAVKSVTFACFLPTHGVYALIYNSNCLTILDQDLVPVTSLSLGAGSVVGMAAHEERGELVISTNNGQVRVVGFVAVVDRTTGEFAVFRLRELARAVLPGIEWLAELHIDTDGGRVLGRCGRTIVIIDYTELVLVSTLDRLSSYIRSWTPMPLNVVEWESFEGHTGRINALQAASSLDCIISAAADGTVRLWDLDSAGCISKVHTSYQVSSRSSAAQRHNAKRMSEANESAAVRARERKLHVTGGATEAGAGSLESLTELEPGSDGQPPGASAGSAHLYNKPPHALLFVDDDALDVYARTIVVFSENVITLMHVFEQPVLFAQLPWRATGISWIPPVELPPTTPTDALNASLPALAASLRSSIASIQKTGPRSSSPDKAGGGSIDDPQLAAALAVLARLAVKGHFVALCGDGKIRVLDAESCEPVKAYSFFDLAEIRRIAAQEEALLTAQARPSAEQAATVRRQLNQSYAAYAKKRLNSDYVSRRRRRAADAAVDVDGLDGVAKASYISKQLGFQFSAASSALDREGEVGLVGDVLHVERVQQAKQDVEAASLAASAAAIAATKALFTPSSQLLVVGFSDGHLEAIDCEVLGERAMQTDGRKQPPLPRARVGQCDEEVLRAADTLVYSAPQCSSDVVAMMEIPSSMKHCKSCRRMCEAAKATVVAQALVENAAGRINSVPDLRVPAASPAEIRAQLVALLRTLHAEAPVVAIPGSSGQSVREMVDPNYIESDVAVFHHLFAEVELWNMEWAYFAAATIDGGFGVWCSVCRSTLKAGSIFSSRTVLLEYLPRREAVVLASANGVIKALTLDSLMPAGEFHIRIGAEEKIVSTAFEAESQVLVLGSESGRVATAVLVFNRSHLVDVLPQHSFEAHAGGVSSLQICLRGKHLLSCGSDVTIRAHVLRSSTLASCSAALSRLRRAEMRRCREHGFTKANYTRMARHVAAATELNAAKEDAEFVQFMDVGYAAMEEQLAADWVSTLSRRRPLLPGSQSVHGTRSRKISESDVHVVGGASIHALDVFMDRGYRQARREVEGLRDEYVREISALLLRIDLDAESGLEANATLHPPRSIFFHRRLGRH
ncbi:uncharacterized protein AMSG_09177 [Thecamonas trahens ATCC 50062]|uniref:Uncharacterized protein n=1 Tax=Thecamonas trahens ATCC 50062 TaxID=461836 RepID=A0A0L0DLT4_THETB|nr:hypothetical protein AMSG_09177 [Thecamonas trahens ATCC 50062]KNC53001.1 hypothetical protein AMSG_09177 [Thecamonas trahens ATCC 50062]|eukprot:XP_013754888.1 hypothetical protein AMSG_09177 [Thecamonas trahens ATCC 50062]